MQPDSSRIINNAALMGEYANKALYATASQKERGAYQRGIADITGDVLNAAKKGRKEPADIPFHQIVYIQTL